MFFLNSQRLIRAFLVFPFIIGRDGVQFSYHNRSAPSDRSPKHLSAKNIQLGFAFRAKERCLDCSMHARNFSLSGFVSMQCTGLLHGVEACNTPFTLVESGRVSFDAMMLHAKIGNQLHAHFVLKTSRFLSGPSQFRKILNAWDLRLHFDVLFVCMSFWESCRKAVYRLG